MKVICFTRWSMYLKTNLQETYTDRSRCQCSSVMDYKLPYQNKASQTLLLRNHGNCISIKANKTKINGLGKKNVYNKHILAFSAHSRLI